MKKRDKAEGVDEEEENEKGKERTSNFETFINKLGPTVTHYGRKYSFQNDFHS